MIQNISNASNRPNLITISETHLSKPQNHGYSPLKQEKIIPGYNFFHKDQSKKRGGGVGIFIEEMLAENASVENDKLLLMKFLKAYQ